ETLAAVQTAYDRACLAITEGQFLDMQFETRVDVTEADYLRMVSGKTAALLAASTQIGALVAGADAATVEGMAQFGHELGVAFQIVDDILGIWGDPDRTGKQAANDIRRRKKSLPVAIAFDRANETSSARLRAMYGQPTLSEDDVAEVLAILEPVGARDQAQRLADDLHRQAWARLAGLAGPAADLLRELTQSLARREF
ncbi:MAG: polyprenyl synthetase family protein, partial [Anaerolineae bacterium]|nr:polyprenyl synthetase family protein [Anaerolineae bacterium]